MEIPTNADLRIITPDEARLILQKNTRNRPVRAGTVKRYAVQMSAGEWKLTGDTIKLATDSTILDGQHRLLACVEAEKPFEAYIVTGLSPEVYDLIDAGLPRRTSDALHISGEVSVALLAAALGWLYRFEKGTLPHTFQGPKMTAHQAMELLRRHPGMREFVRLANGTHQLAAIGSTSIIAFCYYLFSSQDAALATDFFGKLATGAQLEPDEPVYLLRERLLKEKDQFAKVPKNAIVSLYFRAWIYTKAGKRPKTLLSWRSGTEKFPDIGPIDQGQLTVSA
jgi:hypothetical protein